MPDSPRVERPLHRVDFDNTRLGPLAGITVLDLSRVVAGNMLSLQLADFGADVIKVEPLDGDPLRDWRHGGESLHWKVYARNKRSIAMDLRVPSALEALRSLARRADVFIENYRPGTLEKMGLGPDVLLAANPAIIVVRISGFGQTGPYAHMPGFGTLVEAMSGLADRTGFADREPVLPPTALADMVAGLSGAMATLTALLARERGVTAGQVIDLSLLEPTVGVLGPEPAIYARTGEVKPRAGSGSTNSSPRNVYRCADGRYVALSASTQPTAKRLFETIGRPDVIDDPRFRTNTDRVANRAAVDEILSAWFAGRTREQALSELWASGATVGPVYNSDDLLADPHFIEREVIVEIDDPEGGPLPVHNISPRLSRTPGVWRLPAPGIGQHTDDILAGAGLAPAEIAGLREAGAVR